DIGRRLQEAEGAKLLDEGGGEGRLEGEVKALQRFDAGQMGSAHAALVGALGPSRQLGAHCLLQQGLIRPLLLARRLEHGGDYLGQRGQPQAFERLGHRGRERQRGRGGEGGLTGGTRRAGRHEATPFATATWSAGPALGGTAWTAWTPHSWS